MLLHELETGWINIHASSISFKYKNSNFVTFPASIGLHNKSSECLQIQAENDQDSSNQVVTVTYSKFTLLPTDCLRNFEI